MCLSYSNSITDETWIMKYHSHNSFILARKTVAKQNRVTIFSIFAVVLFERDMARKKVSSAKMKQKEGDKQ